MNLNIMNIMKIVEIIPFLSQGGAQRFVVDLSNKLVDDGHDVTIVSLMSLENMDYFRRIKATDKSRFNREKDRI